MPMPAVPPPITTTSKSPPPLHAASIGAVGAPLFQVRSFIISSSFFQLFLLRPPGALIVFQRFRLHSAVLSGMKSRYLPQPVFVPRVCLPERTEAEDWACRAWHPALAA